MNTGTELLPAGVPRLLRNGQVLKLPTRKALAVVLLLVLEGACRRERLADLLWPDNPATVARRNLRRELFRLREAGLQLQEEGSDTLALAGVALQWPAPAQRGAAWLEAVDDVASGAWAEWLAPQREQLQRRWLAVLHERGQAHEAAGREREALALWLSLHEHAADEAEAALARQHAARLHQLLGEHALALVVGNRAAAEPARAASEASAALPERVPFVGREALLAQLQAACSTGQVVFIDGAPGNGKSRLALEAATAMGGALVVGCRPDDALAPFASAQRMLQRLRAAAPDVLPPAWVRHELAPLVPEWAPQPTAPGPADPHQTLRLARAFAVAWRLLAADNFGALVLDDWQWADASSVAIWDLDRAAADGTWPVARLIVHRAAALSAQALERRRALLDSGAALAVTVPALAAGELLQLVRQLARTDGGERFAARLHQATGGNPLFLQETLRHLWTQGLLAADEQGRWHTPFDAVTTGYDELTVPGTVHDTVLARVRALGAPVRHVLEAASLAGEAFGVHELASATGLDQLATARALEHAHAAQLLQGHAGGLLRFAHDLLREAMQGSLSPARKAALHGRLADARAAAPGPQHAAAIAAHLHAAGRAAEATPWHERAAEHAATVGNWPQALAQRQQACAAALAVGDAAGAARNEAARANVLWRQGDPAAAELALDTAAAHALRAEPAAALSVLLDRAEFEAETGHAERALAAVLAALADPALTEALRWRAIELHADALSHLGRPAEAVPLLRELQARLPPSALRAHQRASVSLMRTLYWAGDLAGSRAENERLLRQAEAAGDVFQVGQQSQGLAASWREAGDHERAMACAQRAETAARQCGHVHSLRAALYTQVVLHADAGRADAALPLIEAAEQAAPFWDNPHLQQAFGEARCYMHYLRGDAAGVRQAIEIPLALGRASDSQNYRVGALHFALDMFLALGDAARARALLAESQEVQSQARGDSMRTDELPVRALQCALLEPGPVRLEADERACEPVFARARADEKARIAATLAQVAWRRGDAARARHWLQQGQAVPGTSLEQRTLLALAALAGPAPTPDDRAPALALLEDAHLGAFDRAALQAAMIR